MLPDKRGYFNGFGGRFVPETLMAALAELEREYRRSVSSKVFGSELNYYLKEYAGRPTPLYFAKNLTKAAGGARIYLKREDLLHTGAHKINNTLGQVLLAVRMGKPRVIAETGAGQHGVATATAAALFGLECGVFMGEEDMKRQAVNVFKMKLLGAKISPVSSGSRTLKDAMNEAIRDWVTNVRSTHYVIGSVAGPHPYPMMVREFQSVIGRETKRQVLAKEGRLPDSIVACVGGGSNAMGIFHPFIDTSTLRYNSGSNPEHLPKDSTELGINPERSRRVDEKVRLRYRSGETSPRRSRRRVGLVGVEAAGLGLDSGRHAATLCRGSIGVLHGSKSYILQDGDGQIKTAHSISAGLDYPGVGPEHSYLKKTRRARYVAVTDKEALEGFRMLTELEGIIPALESAHAVYYAAKLAGRMSRDKLVIVCLSGRGDKDIDIVRGVH